MHKVANRKIIRKLSYRTMKEKGWKNLIAILAIALTALMFTSLFTVGMSLIDSMQEATMRQVGTSAHGGFKYMTGKEYEAVKDAPQIAEISYNIIVGFGDSPALYGIQTEVRYSEEKAAQWRFCAPEKGAMPKEGAECATSTKVLDALGIPHELGSRVPLRVRIGDKVIEEEFILAGFWETKDMVAEEFWVSKEWQEKHIPEREIPYNENLLAGGGLEGYRDVSIILPSAVDIEGRINAIAAWAKLDKDNTYTAVNWAYMTASLDATGVLLGIIVLSIIILSGYLIIYNIFYINVTTDIRYYGLLKTVGTTGKQLKAMVRGQAFFLSALGIPIGLGLGWFVGKGILPFLYHNLDTRGIRNVAVNPWIFAGSALFSLLVVYISCIRPCRLAARVAPIEAVRYVEQIQCKKKTRRTGKVNMLRMAAANMARSRKKAAVVILSLSLSMVLLNSTYTLVKGFDFDKYTEHYLVEDYLVKPVLYADFAKNERNTELVTEQMLSDIRRLPGVESARTMYEKDGRVYLSADSVERFARYTEENREEIGDRRFWEGELVRAKENGAQSGMLYGIPEELFEHLTVTAGALDMEKLKTGRYALLFEKGITGGSHWVGVGDKVRLSEDGEEMEILARVTLPWGMTAQYGIGYFNTNLIMEAEALKRALPENGETAPAGGLHVIVRAKEGEEALAGRELAAYVEHSAEGFALTSKESLREEFASFTGLFAIIGGILCLILGIIGILNFINATVTGILARKQEFAMMESVGMTGSQLRAMLVNEGLFYGLWTIALAATAGNAAGYLLVRAIAEGMWYFTWQFTMKPIIICIPVMVLLAVVIPLICCQTLCRKSIVERLRLSEI